MNCYCRGCKRIMMEDPHHKFVVATQEDFAEVERAVAAYAEVGVVCPYI